MKVPNLKTLQPYYNEVLDGKKKFELRKNKNFIYVQVIYKLEGGIYGLEKGYCVLGIDRYISEHEYLITKFN